MRTRIKEIISHYDLSDRAFAIKCGLKQNTFYNQLKGERDLSLSTIFAILENCKDVSAEWLIRGNGDMLLKNENTDDEINTQRMAAALDVIANMQMENSIAKQRILELESELKKAKGQIAMLRNELNK